MRHQYGTTGKNLKWITMILSMVIVLNVLAPLSFAGKYAGDPYSLGVGARPLALGGAVVAGPFDATSPYWNPAGMGYLESRQIVAMHAETFGSLLHHDFIGYVDGRIREKGLINAFGFYLYYLGGGGIKITELNQSDRPYVLREESHGDFILAASGSRKIRKDVNVGASIKLLYRELGTESGFGLSTDLGATWQAKNYLMVGMMITDVTTGFIRYSGKTFGQAHSESIFPTFKPGVMVSHTYREFTGSMMASGDIKFENLKYSAQYWVGAISMDTHLGWEVGYKGMLFGRAGFDIGRFTTGVGINYHGATFDFAYLHHGQLDETLRFSAGYRFK